MADLLPILAIETSGELCSVALMMDVKSSLEFNYLQKYIHSEKLIEMIQTVLAISKVELNHVQSIAVSIGPGSFTGLRIGLSAAKGLALGSNLPIIPVPTFSAFAQQLSENLQSGESFGIISNANIDEVYYSKFQKKNNRVEIIEDLKLVKKISLKEAAQSVNRIFGDIELENLIKTPFGSTAFSIAKWAYLFGKDLVTSNYDSLEPNYFKKFIPRAAR